MASLSRGFGPRLLLVFQRPPPSQCSGLRSGLPLQQPILAVRFSTSRLRLLQKPPRPTANPNPRPAPAAKQAAKPAAKPSLAAKPSSPPPPTPAAAPRPVPPSYAEILAQRGRTLLYEAPSHFWFRTGCFTSATFCISYTVYQYWTIILHPPEGLLWWVPHAFGVILIFMSGMGVYFVLGAGRIVRSIEAVPAAQVAKHILSKATAGTTGAAATAAPPVLIELTTLRPIPFFPPKKTVLPPDQVQLPFRMHNLFAPPPANPTSKPLTLSEQIKAAHLERAAREARRKETTAPFRDARRVFSAAWHGIKRSFSREGFARILVGKTEYKLDVTGGWALDEGRAMDRLLSIRPNALMSTGVVRRGL
jgi:hypothetical protein